MINKEFTFSILNKCECDNCKKQDEVFITADKQLNYKAIQKMTEDLKTLDIDGFFCVMCHVWIEGWSCNPYPLANYDYNDYEYNNCCNDCDMLVLEQRLRDYGILSKYKDK